MEANRIWVERNPSISILSPAQAREQNWALRQICEFGPHHDLQLRGPESCRRQRDGVRALLRQGLRVAVRAALPGQRNRIIKSDLATFSITQ